MRVNIVEYTIDVTALTYFLIPMAFAVYRIYPTKQEEIRSVSHYDDNDCY